MVDKRKVLTRVALVTAASFMATCKGGGDDKTGKAIERDTTENLQLIQETTSCTANGVQSFFRVTNNDTAPIALSDITVKLWVNETTANAVLASASNGCVSTGQSDSCNHSVGATKVNVAASPQACASQEANWEVTIRTNDHSSLNPGQSWTHFGVNLTLPRSANFTPGTSSWYTGCMGSSYAPPTHTALYFQGSLVRASTGIPPSCTVVLPPGSQTVGGATAPAIANGLVPLVGHLDGTTPIFLGISLPLNENGNTPTTPPLATLFQNLYDPTSEQFGQYLTPAQFGASYGTSQADYNTVVAALQAAGLTVFKTYSNLSHISVTGTAQQVENALHVTLNQYRRPDGTIFYAPANDPSLVANVPIAFIAGLDSYAVPVANNGTSADAYSNCPQNTSNSDTHAYFGDDFKNIYLGDASATGSGTTAAVVAFDSYAPTNLGAGFTSDPGLYANRANAIRTISGLPTIALNDHQIGVAGAVTTGGSEPEVALSVQMVYAMAPAATINVYEFAAQTNNHCSQNTSTSCATVGVSCGAGNGICTRDPYQGSSASFPTIMNRIAEDATANVVINPWTWQSGGANVDPGVANVLFQAAVQGIGFYQASGDAGAYTSPYTASQPTNYCQFTPLAATCATSSDCATNTCDTVTTHKCTASTTVACSTDNDCPKNSCISPGVPEPMINSPLMTVVGGTTLPTGPGIEGMKTGATTGCTTNLGCASNTCLCGDGVTEGTSISPCASTGTCVTGESAWANGLPSPITSGPPHATGGGYAVTYTGFLGLAYPALSLPTYQAGISSTCSGGHCTVSGAACSIPADCANTVRMVPDVSIVADQITMYVNGGNNPANSQSCDLPQTGGTSASVALWGGLALLIDQAANAISTGHPRLGFANPSLYQKATAAYDTNFNDVGWNLHATGIPGGAALNASGNGNLADFAYATGKGYDLASGLGTPKANLVTANGILPPQSCQSGSNLTILINPDGSVVAYAPNGSWSQGATGVAMVPLELATSASSGTPLGAAQLLSTATPINTCAGDSSGAGNVVCTDNVNTLYLINGTTVTTLANTAVSTSDQEVFSGGACSQCNVAVDPQSHLAYVSMATASGPALEVVDIPTAMTGSAAALKSTIPLNIPPGVAPFFLRGTAEAIQVDTTRSVILSPNEVGNYQVISYQPNTGNSVAYDFDMTSMPGLVGPFFDSAAEDCSTGIAIAPVEVNDSIGPSNQVVLVDLTMGVFNRRCSTTPFNVCNSSADCGGGGTCPVNGTWAPGRCSTTNAPCATTNDCPGGVGDNCSRFAGAGATAITQITSAGFGDLGGVAIASDGSHLGIVATEFGGPGFAVIQLPATAGSNNPQLVNYVVAQLPNTPNGVAWQMGLDPHTIGVYRSATTSKVYGVFQNNAGPRDYIAVVDLAALNTKGHNIQVPGSFWDNTNTCCSQSPTLACPDPATTPGCIVRFVKNTP